MTPKHENIRKNIMVIPDGASTCGQHGSLFSEHKRVCMKQGMVNQTGAKVASGCCSSPFALVDNRMISRNTLSRVEDEHV